MNDVPRQSPDALPATPDIVVAAAPLPPLSRVPGWLIRAGSAAWFGLGIVAAVVVAYYALAQMRSLVAPLVVAAVMGMLFYPVVDRLATAGLGRGIGAAITLVGIAGITVAALWLAVRGVIDQGSQIAESLEQGWVQVQAWIQDLGFDLANLNRFTDTLSSAGGGGVGGLVQSTFSGLASFLIGLFIGTFLLFYLLKDWHIISSWLAGHSGLPSDLGAGLIEDATGSIRRYFYGLALTAVPIAIVIGATMAILGLPLAFTVTLVTFVTAFIPYIGAIVSGAFAVLVALGSGGPVPALIVLGVVLLTQNVLQTLLLTKITSDKLSLHPIVNLGSTVVGATLAGILGATLSAPVVAMVIAARNRVTTYAWAPTGDAQDDDADLDGLRETGVSLPRTQGRLRQRARRLRGRGYSNG